MNMSDPITINNRPANAHIHDIRVNWGDCDPARIAYTARLPAFALDAINGWWEAKFEGNGWYQLVIDRNVGTPFVHMSLDFHHPVTPRHLLQCHVWPTRLGNKSIEFWVDGCQNGVVCFSGQFVCVFTISDEHISTKPPSDIRLMVEAHLDGAAN